MVEDTGQSAQGKTPDAGKSTKEAGSSSDSTTKSGEGKVEAEKHGYASELVAYRVIDNLAAIIANRVETKLKNDESARILLVDDLEQAAGGLALAEIKAHAELIKSVFDERETEHKELLKVAEAPALGPPSLTVHQLTFTAPLAIAKTAVSSLWPQIPQAIDTINDVLAYFDSSYKVVGREMSVAKQALLCSTAGSLSGRGLVAFIPGFYETKNSPLLEKLTNLAYQSARLKTERDYLAEELPKKSEPIGKGSGGNGQRESEADSDNADPAELPDGERLAKVTKAVRETDAALLAYEGLRASWTASPGSKVKGEDTSAVKSGTTPTAKSAEGEPSKLGQALTQETIEKLEITHLLCLSHFSSGGESTIRDRMMPFADREGFMGGSALGYILAGTDGRILAADTFAQFGIIGGKIKELTEGRDFEDIDYKPDYPHGRYTADD